MAKEKTNPKDEVVKNEDNETKTEPIEDMQTSNIEFPGLSKFDLLNELNNIKFLTDPIRYNGIIYQGMQIMIKKITTIEEQLTQILEKSINESKK